MANDIQADYERLQQIAQRFRAQAQGVQQLTQQVKSKMGRLQQTWEGRAADAFFLEMNQVLLPGINRLQKAFDHSSLTVTKIANVMKEAETTAANLFKGNATGGGGEAATGYGGGYDEGGGYANSTLIRDYPSYNEQGGDPQDSPILSPEQIEALAELGITVEDLAGATPDEIQNAIDFLSSDDRISDTILDEGTYTGAELVEAVGILERLEGVGIEFGQSKFNEDTWSLGELRQAGETFDQLAQGAAREYI
jgi:WXG100 family type VII secretion target